MIDELALEKGFWPILALDHGLTVGHDSSVNINEVPFLLQRCADAFGSVVMTYGMARHIRGEEHVPMIIQCFGAPLGHPKVQVCSVESAISLGASGVAVQIDFSLPGEYMLDQLRSVSLLASQAHSRQLPVLFMVTPHEMTDNRQLYHFIRFCVELGADLIKVRCSTLTLEEERRDELADLLRSAPPVLLAGGKTHDKIVDEVSVSREIGFSGYCIGRNIFQAADAGMMSRLLLNAWKQSKI